MPKGGYSESTRRWTTSEILQLLDLIKTYKHKWTKIQKHMPDRSWNQIRLWWLRHRRSLNTNGPTGRPMYCKKCGELKFAHVCLKEVTQDCIEKARNLCEFGKNNSHLKKAPKMACDNSTDKKSFTHTKEPLTEWKPTPPKTNSGTAQDFDMLIDYVRQSVASNTRH